MMASKKNFDSFSLFFPHCRCYCFRQTHSFELSQQFVQNSRVWIDQIEIWFDSEKPKIFGDKNLKKVKKIENLIFSNIFQQSFFSEWNKFFLPRNKDGEKWIENVGAETFVRTFGAWNSKFT